ncbi:hypothetical protein KY343_02400 [Candidatus Woesearchaeota archaeon]|nr:hypothetical protein [Candidatus Woesearchaeota archaeon]
MTKVSRRGFLGIAGLGLAAILAGCNPSMVDSDKDLVQLVSEQDIPKNRGALMTYPHSCMNGAFLDWDGLTEEYEEMKFCLSIANKYEKPRYQKRLKKIEDKMAAKFGGGLEVSDQVKREFDKIKKIYGDRASLVKTITFKDLVEAIESAGQANNGLSHLIIGGHGEPKSIKLGLDTYFSLSDVDKPEFVRLKKYINGPVYLESCSTGAPQSDGECMAQAISRVWKTEVHGLVVPSATGFTPNLRLYTVKTRKGFIKDAVYFEGFSDGMYTVEHTPNEFKSFEYNVKLDQEGKVDSIELLNLFLERKNLMECYEIQKQGLSYVRECEKPRIQRRLKEIQDEMAEKAKYEMTPEERESMEHVKQSIDNCNEPFYQDMVRAKKGHFRLSPNLIAVYKNGKRIK